MPISSINPATGEVLKTFAALNKRELEEKLSRAANCFREHRRTTFHDRAAMMNRAAEILESEKKSIARMMTLEMGKPINAAIQEAEKCAWVCRYYAENAERHLTDEHVATNATRSYVRFQPLGVVLAIMPWNFPFWQAFRAGLPALAAGNVMLLKHASNVPQAALAIEEVFREAGLPEGVFQTLLIGSAAVEGLIADRRVAGVTLTGSEKAGSLVAESAGRSLKKTVLELGGSDPFIVLADADVNAAAAVACRARNQNNGQSRFAAAVAALKVGNPMDRANQLGPLARADLVDELERQVNESVRLGARPLTG